jgi:hypothetical protein
VRKQLKQVINSMNSFPTPQIRSLFWISVLLLMPALSIAQSWQWAASMGNTGASANTEPDEMVNDMAVDQWGNVYVVGEIYQGGLIGGQPISYWGIYATGFIAKYDCQGDLIWAKTWGSVQPARGSQIELDASGKVIFTGRAIGTNLIPGYELHFLDSVIADEIGDAFVARVDTAGQLDWVRFAGPNTSSLGTIIQGLTTNKDDQLVVLIGVGMPGEVYSGHNCPDRGTYVFKFDTLGNVLQSAFLTDRIDGNSYWSTAMDDENGIYLTMRLDGDTLIYGGQQILKQGSAQFDLLFIKVDSLYNTQWYEQMGDSLYSGVGYGVQVDSLNDVYLTGFVMNGRELQGHVFTNSLAANANVSTTFIAKFNSVGNLLWADNIHVQWGCAGMGKLGLDKNYGKLFFSGVYGGQGLFGSTPLTSVSLTDFYLAEVSPSGLIQSGTTFATTGTKPYPSCTQVDDAGNVYVGGSFDGTITINGVTQTNQGGRSNGFIAKFGYVCTTGLDEEQVISESDELLVYPNPAEERVTIQIPEQMSEAVVVITDVAGREVRRIANVHENERTISFEIRDLPSGVYFVLLQGVGEVRSAKFVKQ